jgi:dimethylhistidine N-methyltransferase
VIRSGTARALAPTRKADDGGFRRDVLHGLSRRPRSLPSRHFYDAQGSRLFQWITRLPEYYLTRTERSVLGRHADAIAAPFLGRACAVVDLGAGDGHKTQLVLEPLRRAGARLIYAPVDLSEEALDEAARRVTEAMPTVEVQPIRAEYAAALRRLDRSGHREARLVLFLGSSIGNLEPPEAVGFLRQLAVRLRPGDHLLVGFDMVKPLALLRPAYQDARGVTRAFNLNLLVRINRELEGDLELDAFEHRVSWDPERPAMESWLESTRRQVVHVAGRAFELEAGERIQTEISCKYTAGHLDAFGLQAGLTEVARFQDEQGWFTDVLWRG